MDAKTAPQGVTIAREFTLIDVRNQGNRLHRRMHRQLFVAAALQRVDARIAPKICAIPATFNEAEIIQVRCMATWQTKTNSCWDR